MKLQSLSVTNFQILAALDIDLSSSRVHLFGGDNEQGKTTIGDAVRYALTGQPPRVDKKSDYKLMVRDGAKEGDIRLTVDGVVNSINLPKGTVCDSINSRDLNMLPLVLNPERFASLTADARRAVLYELTGLEITADKVRARLHRKPEFAEQAMKDRLEEVLPLIQSEFDAASKAAAKKATEARGGWKEVTKESYGSVKGENWSAEKPEFDEAVIAAKTQELNALIEKIGEAHQNIGATRARDEQAKQRATKLAQLKLIAEQFHERTRLLSLAQKETVDFEKTVDEARAKAGDRSTVAAQHHNCPSCNAELAIINGKLVHHIPLKVDQEALAKLPDLEKGLDVLKNAESSRQRLRDEAVAAQQQIDAMAAEDQLTGEPPESLDAAEANLAVLKGLAQSVSAELGEMTRLRDEAMAADEKTEAAAGYHADIAAWSKIADVFSPDGLPSELLADALKPINKRLQGTSALTGWKQVLIKPDMSIEVDGRPYSMMSESAKWKADASIAESVSFLSGLRILLLDRLDILAPNSAGRSAMLKWAIHLANVDEINSLLMFATLKEPPKLPDSIQTYWIENGDLSIPA